MPAKKKQVGKRATGNAAGKRRAGGKTVSRSTSGITARASAERGAEVSCEHNCVTTPDQANAYMRAEILWSTLYLEAWSDNDLLYEMVKHENNANEFIEEQGRKRNLPVKVPPGVTLKIVFDTPNTVHLVMPVVQNIPPRPLDMVPHAL